MQGWCSNDSDTPIHKELVEINEDSTSSQIWEDRMKVKRAALYARVSTLVGQSPEMQLVELREYAAQRGWQVVEEYVDHGVSGAKESRPALNQMMTGAKQRRFDLIAVWKIDRFGRSLRHL